MCAAQLEERTTAATAHVGCRALGCAHVPVYQHDEDEAEEPYYMDRRHGALMGQSTFTALSVCEPSVLGSPMSLAGTAVDPYSCR
eukprot:m51a1_g9827 hypothetical protein (85) ;mRNA; f:1915416-1915899